MSFEDRTKNNIKDEGHVRVITSVKTKEQTEAFKKLYGEKDIPPVEDIKEKVKAEILSRPNSAQQETPKVNNAYLKKFENKVVTDELQKQEITEQNSKSEMDFSSLVQEKTMVENNQEIVKKELQKAAPKPKKNYSFRIKLVAGVYCIIVALFGGWVISNTINISKTNQSLYETTIETTETNANIAEIVAKINQTDVDDDNILSEIIKKEIQLTPETITQPTEYKKDSNWFDVICNWISKIFGG